MEHSFDHTYEKNKELYGHPYRELQDYFRSHTKGTLLDLGCGQGRDAIFLASIGYEVTAVDSSKVGIAQMLSKAKEKNLEIKGIVSDVESLELKETFEIILFDMLLHSFDKEERIKLLHKYSKYLSEKGLMCIVYPDDMRKEFSDLFSDWNIEETIVVKDVPKLSEEDEDYTFEMIIVQKN